MDIQPHLPGQSPHSGRDGGSIAVHVKGRETTEKRDELRLVLVEGRRASHNAPSPGSMLRYGVRSSACVLGACVVDAMPACLSGFSPAWGSPGMRSCILFCVHNEDSVPSKQPPSRPLLFRRIFSKWRMTQKFSWVAHSSLVLIVLTSTGSCYANLATNSRTLHLLLRPLRAL